MRFPFRENLLLWVSAVAYLALLGTVALVMDLQFYQTAKADLIRSEDFPDYPPQLPSGVVSASRDLASDLEAQAILESPDPDATIRETLLAQELDEQERADLLARLPSETEIKKIQLQRVRLDPATRQAKKQILEERMREIQDRYASVISVRVFAGKTELLRVDRADARRLNSFRNSLILRDFTVRASAPIYGTVFPEERIGSLIFVYTSPIGYAPVEKLTRSYWIYLAAVLFFLTLAYVLMLRFLLLPIKNVTEAIQRADGRPARFLRAPYSRLERVYNAMARDAMLAALSGDLRSSAHRLGIDPRELFDFLTPRIVNWFDFDAAWVLDLVWEGPSLLSLESQIPENKPGEPPAWEMLRPVFDQEVAHNLRASRESETPHLIPRDLPGKNGRVFIGALPVGNTADPTVRVLAIQKKAAAEEMPWFESTADRIYRLAVEMAGRIMSQSRELFREKSEAHISLSRNLGHDLTNIIATNKLELMTIREILRGGAARALDAGEQTKIVRETLDRLLDNTRGLQEIVNLYRTYEYLKSPRYEAADLNRLIAEIVETFRLSTSCAVEITFDLEDGMPPIEVEPRLFKLAVFNLLVNALDAIRLLPPDKQSAARISVQTRLARDKTKATVRISDTGQGIRTADGRLAGKEEIRRVFELGYTTKAGGQAEGLGLNWVRTILTEFHAGDLRAYNRPEGGATIEFCLAATRRAPSKTSQEGSRSAS